MHAWKLERSVRTIAQGEDFETVMCGRVALAPYDGKALAMSRADFQCRPCVNVLFTYALRPGAFPRSRITSRACSCKMARKLGSHDPVVIVSNDLFVQVRSLIACFSIQF